jgi:hypothetical protein
MGGMGMGGFGGMGFSSGMGMMGLGGYGMDIRRGNSK